MTLPQVERQRGSEAHGAKSPGRAPTGEAFTHSPWFESSRDRRPLHPPPLTLTERDRALLVSVVEHRLLTLEHLHALHFRTSSLRAAQMRVRSLWAHQYLDRLLLPAVERERTFAQRPLYALGTEGRRELARLGRITPERLGRSRERLAGSALFVKHDLVVTDFLVALEVACSESQRAVLLEASRDDDLDHCRRQRHSTTLPRCGNEVIVPDAAVRLWNKATNTTGTYYLEVVRAGTKGGNRSLLAKMHRYLRLLGEGWFQASYGHQDLRAVLIATTSRDRAENFADLTTGLRHGHTRFWFGAYPRPHPTLLPETTFTPETIFAPLWFDRNRDTHSLLDEEAGQTMLVLPPQPLSFPPMASAMAVTESR